MVYYYDSYKTIVEEYSNFSFNVHYKRQRKDTPDCLIMLSKACLLLGLPYDIWKDS